MTGAGRMPTALVLYPESPSAVKFRWLGFLYLDLSCPKQVRGITIIAQRSDDSKPLAGAEFRLTQAGSQMWLSLQTAIEKFLTALPHHPCLLLVHPSIVRLQEAKELIVHHYSWPVLFVGQILSRNLLSVAPKRRPHKAPRAFSEAVQAYQPGPVLCIDIDLLFEPSLSLDPLRILKNASRRATLVATWPGTFMDGMLTYATAEHGHYRIWSQPGLCDYCIIAL
jgi:hypothetical protein